MDDTTVLEIWDLVFIQIKMQMAYIEQMGSNAIIIYIIVH